MNGFRKAGLLPHEWFFGAFLVILWARLVRVAGPWDSDSLLYSSLILVNISVIAWCGLRDSSVSWWFRLFFYPVAMNLVFVNMKTSVLKVAAHKWDGVLAVIDKAFFGAILSVRSQELINPVLTEILSFCYLLFFPYLLISWLYYAWRGLPLLRKLIVGMFTIYGFGFLGYSFVPAGGPYLAFPGEFTVSLTGWAVSRFNELIVEKGSNGVDVFPSLHCAISCFLLFFDRKHAPWRFRIYLIPCIGIWLATIYLRYHYFADLIAGFVLAAFALWLAGRWEKSFRNP